MGLAGRKTKQRIGADPRNLSWVDDASRFGSAYLSKFGWDSSKGLGVTGDGRTSHIKVSHKLDMLGIGAANTHDPNGIAWKQNKDFENLLRRLNEVADGKGEEDVGTNVEGFVSQGKGVDESEETVERVDKVEKSEKKRKRKQKAREEEDKMDSESEDEDGKKKKEKDSELEGKKRKRKDKKDKEHKEHKSKKRKTSEESKPEESIPKAQEETPTPSAPAIIPRHRPHRARAIAAKKMVSTSATAISEILGIAHTWPSTTSSTPSGSATPHGQLTTLDDDGTAEKITTSTKSVADYFKEKLLSRSSGSTPTNSKMDPDDYACDAPRGGIGSSRVKMNTGDDDRFKSSSLAGSSTPEAENEETGKRKKGKDEKRRRRKNEE